MLLVATTDTPSSEASAPDTLQSDAGETSAKGASKWDPKPAISASGCRLSTLTAYRATRAHSRSTVE
eukprot:CAMPEP_0114156930 /NCGR_PEP_ID=MMETSP0043_2-20121206/26327_1 /TAXON_ID=464988 /ORGANISM="Hemiselmis andersenii, Strain CCMP644" /LENGTH=66 /DNA_ID=CAMNT_0001252417 /DNA_START=217 /DNA_END=414 /DNA_ORIENTATION=+